MSLNRFDAHPRDRGPAPAYTKHDFSPAAILSRARAYAAERAAELAARPPRADGRTGAEILAAIEAALAPAEPAVAASHHIEQLAQCSPDAPFADMARTIDGGRA